jgi:hypothetical protein
MPTTAATGTRQVSTAGKSAKRKTSDAVDSTELPSEPFDSQTATDHPPAPPADLNSGGLVQVVLPDGRHVNVDSGSEGWEDEVRALDPKHPSVRDA